MHACMLFGDCDESDIWGASQKTCLLYLIGQKNQLQAAGMQSCAVCTCSLAIIIDGAGTPNETKHSTEQYNLRGGNSQNSQNSGLVRPGGGRKQCGVEAVRPVLFWVPCCY